ncbi:unnamed protein product [Cuscuta campestris]|uniref:PPIase cyclophilin-type domain-containing protein n=1 Tax=Cuscuta campestris TaxID=132261 RepID=A0A484NLZ9_9ASTE|nr:unnamed protein product [Cuscuta campestris]
MSRKQNGSGPTKWASMVLLIMGLISCIVVYAFISAALTPGAEKIESLEEETGERVEGCCRGVENLELWGPAVNWGADFKLNSSAECCRACRAMCSSGESGPCLCDTWVFCGNREACGSKFGECWLKKQQDTFRPDRQEAGNKTMWTSGIIFGRGKGIVALETEHGTIRVKLLPECSPHSIMYILELLSSRHCAGCRFYRAEGRGEVWDSQGNHIKDASFGPPYALVQGTLEAQGVAFTDIPSEFCPTITRGSVAWIGSGPEFFISLSNHQEWTNQYTVFGSVVAEDMEIVERIAQLPIKPDVWSGVSVSVLEKHVPLKVRRIEIARG